MAPLEPLDPGLFRPTEGFARAPVAGDLAAARLVVLGLPFDMGVDPERVGARLGPAGIRAQARRLKRFYPPFGTEDPVVALGLIDIGDAQVQPGRIAPSFAAMEAAVAAVARAGPRTLTMGGDGSVTLPQLRALSRRFPDLAVLHFDAHTDTNPPPAPDAHTTGTTFTYAAEEGLIDVARSFHVGARGPATLPNGLDYTRGHGYRVVAMEDLRTRGFADLLAEIHDCLAGRPVYLCWDMDVFDASVAPGVCDPTWGGFSAQEGFDLLHGLAGLDLVAFDVNTVSPPHDVGGMTAHLAGIVMALCLHLALKGPAPED